MEEQQVQEKDRGNLFRQEALDRAASPDQLNDYIRVYSPSVWIVLGAVIIVLASMLVWSYFGRLPTVLKETGEVKDGVVTCYVSDKLNLRPGLPVVIGTDRGEITEVSQRPLSRREVEAKYSDDYTVHILGIEDWNYVVRASVSGVPDGLAELRIETDTVAPMKLIFN